MILSSQDDIFYMYAYRYFEFHIINNKEIKFYSDVYNHDDNGDVDNCVYVDSFFYHRNSFDVDEFYDWLLSINMCEYERNSYSIKNMMYGLMSYMNLPASIMSKFEWSGRVWEYEIY